MTCLNHAAWHTGLLCPGIAGALFMLCTVQTLLFYSAISMKSFSIVYNECNLNVHNYLSSANRFYLFIFIVLIIITRNPN